MKTKLFAPSFPRLQALGFLGLMLACGSAKAQVYDYDYSCTRFLDPITGDPVTEYDNFATDSSGDVYSYALPLYVGSDPNVSTPLMLDPGFSLDITNVPAGQQGGLPGGGLVIGKPKPLPAGGGGLPPGGGNVFFPIGQTNKHNGTITITAVSPGLQIRFRPNGQGNFNPPGNVKVGDTFTDGCIQWNGPVSWTGCNVQLTNLADGSFSSVYTILGGGANWPNSSPSSFYASANFDLVYIGNSTNAFDGSGFGTADIQCNNDEFMSVATPEAYVGCPEPGTLSVVCLGTASLLACAGRRRKAKAQGRHN